MWTFGRLHLTALACCALSSFSVHGLPDEEFSQSQRENLYLYTRAENADGSVPVYKDPTASIEDRVSDLLPRMTIQEKVAQMYASPFHSLFVSELISFPFPLISIQGDIDGWMNVSDPLDDTLTYNASGLVDMMSTKAGSIWGGYLMPWDKWVFAVEVGQRYLMENTTLGIPAMFQSEGKIT